MSPINYAYLIPELSAPWMDDDGRPAYDDSKEFSDFGPRHVPDSVPVPVQQPLVQLPMQRPMQRPVQNGINRLVVKEPLSLWPTPVQGGANDLDTVVSSLLHTLTDDSVHDIGQKKLTVGQASAIFMLHADGRSRNEISDAVFGSRNGSRFAAIAQVIGEFRNEPV